MITKENHFFLILFLIGVVAIPEGASKNFSIRNFLGYVGYFCIAAVLIVSYLKLKIVSEQIKNWVDRNQLSLILVCLLQLLYVQFYNIGVILDVAPTFSNISSALLSATAWILVTYVFFKYVIKGQKR